MSEQRNGSRLIPSFLSRHHRLVSGGVAALLVSGLTLGGLASPASAAALPNNVTLEQWADVEGNWVTGALGLQGQGASAYEEGETVPFSLDVTGAGAGAFDFSVCRDYDNGAIRGYLSLEPYSTSRTPLIPGTVTSAATGSAQPFTGVAVVGGVSIDSVTEVGGAGACGAGQRETQVAITVAPGSSGAYVLWGGRLASPADAEVGPARGASQFSGGSLSMRLGGSAKNVGIKTAAIIQLSTVTAQKVVDSGSATADQFCFSINPDPNNVGPQCPATGQSTVAFVGLPTGSYAVTEVGLPGYGFASGSGTKCSFAAGIGTAGVAVGNTPTNATCVFHNRRLTGTLTVNNVLDPALDPGLFNLQIDGATAGTGANVGNGGTTGVITASSGSHAVGATGGTDTDIDDYITLVSCVDDNGPVSLSGTSVSVADGQDVVCTVTITREVVITTTTLAPTTTTTLAPTTTTTLAPTTTTTAPVVDPKVEEDPCTRVGLSRGNNNPCREVVVQPVVKDEPTTTTPAAPVVDPGTTVAGGGEQAFPAPEQVLSGQVEQAMPAPADNLLVSGGSLPRTGLGIGSELTLAFGLVGSGLALLRLARRRRPAAQQ